MKVTFRKGDLVKVINSPSQDRIDACLEAGYVIEGDNIVGENNVVEPVKRRGRPPKGK